MILSMSVPPCGFATLRKIVRLDIISTSPRQFAHAITRALQKKTQDAFGGVPSTGVNANDLISGFPSNLSDPSGESGDVAYALPAEVHQADDDLLREGDTIFEVLTLSSAVYVASHPVDFFREVWFDGLAAERNDHYTLANSGEAIAPIETLASGTSVTAKYVLAG